jgi:hypothetical protein
MPVPALGSPWTTVDDRRWFPHIRIPTAAVRPWSETRDGEQVARVGAAERIDHCPALRIADTTGFSIAFRFCFSLWVPETVNPCHPVADVLPGKDSRSQRSLLAGVSVLET